MADVFADRLADICNGVIVIKLGQGLSILSACTSCSAVAALQLKPNSLVNQVMTFSRVSMFGAIVLDEVAGYRIKRGSFLCHSSRRVKWV